MAPQNTPTGQDQTNFAVKILKFFGEFLLSLLGSILAMPAAGGAIGLLAGGMLGANAGWPLSYILYCGAAGVVAGFIFFIWSEVG